MPRTDVTIRVSDFWDVKALLDQLAQRVEQLEHERDEWQEQYADLLKSMRG
jgi:FtsZ-binding cell division protein ZapB